MSAKPVLFIDFDGTLCHDRFWRSLGPDHSKKIQSSLFSQDLRLVTDWMKGAYSSEEVNEKLALTLNVPFGFLWETFVKDCAGMSVDEAVLKKVNGLRKKYKTVLITDNMDCFERFTVPALKLDEYFDVIVCSSKEKMLKNEDGGKLFRDVMLRFDGIPAQSILIDDSKRSCSTFEALGGRSFLITKEKPLSHWLASMP